LFYPPNFINNSKNIEKRLDYATLKFSLLSNFIALLGGIIKSKQMLSGNMSDIVSNIYLGYSLLWYHHHHLKNNHKLLKEQSIIYLLNEIDSKINLIIDNYPIQSMKFLLCPLRSKVNSVCLENKNHLYKYILSNEELTSIFKEDIYYKGTVVEKMEHIKNLEPNSKEYNDFYNDIISVGEYKIK